jgi:DNA-binding IclR family transcriptional regulator
MSRKRRDESDYQIEALAKGLRVLEALEGSHFEPVTTKRVHERTKLPYDTCMRALRTLKLAGFAVETDRGLWLLSARFIAFCQRAAEAQIAP